MSAGPLSRAFRAALDDAGSVPGDLESRLEELASEAADANADGDFDAEAFVRFVAEKLSGVQEVGDALDRIRAADLGLVHRCLADDRRAIDRLEREYMRDVPHMLARLRLSPDEADDVRQRLRQRLLIGTAHGPPRLATYAGRGDLRNWIRTAAMRVAQNAIEADLRHVAVDTDGLERAVQGGRDLQLDYLRNEYGKQFKQAFEAAVEGLSTRERNLLRFHYIDGLTSDALSAMYGVHRATAARWVASARRQLSTQTRRNMMAAIGVGRADLQSIMRLIQSQLDVSVRRCLGDD